jgi:hypothetical protein
MFAAFYRCLYGEDFFPESINSIIDAVDHVFILLADRPWGDADRCVYRGSTIYFPSIIDNLPQTVRSAAAIEKVTVISAYNPLNRDMAGWALTTISHHSPRPINKLLFMEPDMVWDTGQLNKFIQIYDASNYRTMTASQIELWRTFKWRVPRRSGRSGPFLWELSSQTRFGDIETSEASVHNLGFCVSDRAMFWKHMIGLGISGPLQDSMPNEEWFEKIWLNWHPTSNNKNLEISRGAEHNLTHAFKHDETLPVLLQSSRWPWLIERDAIYDRAL